MTQSPTPAEYRGRFAPSPTGPLHFGSLVAALASYADARANDGAWLVRMEDLDPPREMPGAATGILRTLEAFGFEWDGPVLYQSARGDRYQAVLDALGERRLAYACACTRREVADSLLRAGRGAGAHSDPVYPGTCRPGLPPGRTPRALRIRVDDAVEMFIDGIQGEVRQSLATEVGDFVLKRADGPWAYQLAVVVDDADQGVTDVVRGADLLGSTPRQRYLQRLIGLPHPRYLHVPVVVDAAGEKLSKQTLAAPVDATRPARALCRALGFLGQQPPAGLGDATATEVLAWAARHWSRTGIPRARSGPLPAS